MGNNLAKIFPHKGTHPLKELAGKVIAIDIAPWIYTSIYSTGLYRVEIEKRVERITAHVYKILQLVVGLKSAGIEVVICLDEKNPHIKKETVSRRRATTRKSIETLQAKVETGAITASGHKALRLARVMNSPQSRAQIIRDLITSLHLAGVPYISRANEEGEKLCHWLKVQGVVNGVYSRDRDVCIYGTDLICDIDIKNGTYTVIPSEKNFLALGLSSLRQLQIATVVSGTDYHPGLYGIGPVKALVLVKNTPQCEIFRRCEEEGVPLSQVLNYYDDTPVVTGLYRSTPDPIGLQAFLRELGFGQKSINKVIIGLADVDKASYYDHPSPP